ncbi:41376_t:CDS:10, partial [Gigaspora margarita]
MGKFDKATLDGRLKKISKHNVKIYNWAKTAYNTSELYFEPESEDDIKKIIELAKRNKKNIKVIGMVHSPSDLPFSDGYIISMNKLNRIIKIDQEKKTVTVEAGIKITQLNEELSKHGLALSNLCSISELTIGGAISTATHGTGVNFGCLSTQIKCLTLLTDSHGKMHCSETMNSDVFKATLCNLGALGIITQVTIQCETAYLLEANQIPVKLNYILDNLDAIVHSAEHIRFWWFPHTDDCIAWKANRTNKVYVNEWAIPIEKAKYAIKDLKRWIETNEISVHCPVEIRFVDQDDIWLSPAYGRKVCYIGIIMYRPYYQPVPYKKYWAGYESIMRSYDGRPHWAKTHTMFRSELEKVYPKFQSFIELQKQLDPTGLFLNPYLRRHLFGENVDVIKAKLCELESLDNLGKAKGAEPGRNFEPALNNNKNSKFDFETFPDGFGNIPSDDTGSRPKSSNDFLPPRMPASWGFSEGTLLDKAVLFGEVEYVYMARQVALEKVYVVRVADEDGWSVAAKLPQSFLQPNWCNLGQAAFSCPTSLKGHETELNSQESSGTYFSDHQAPYSALRFGVSKEVVCYLCEDKGHYANKCYFKKQGGGIGQGTVSDRKVAFKNSSSLLEGGYKASTNRNGVVGKESSTLSKRGNERTGAIELVGQGKERPDWLLEVSPVFVVLKPGPRSEGKRKLGPCSEAKILWPVYRYIEGLVVVLKKKIDLTVTSLKELLRSPKVSARSLVLVIGKVQSLARAFALAQALEDMQWLIENLKNWNGHLAWKLSRIKTVHVDASIIELVAARNWRGILLANVIAQLESIAVLAYKSSAKEWSSEMAKRYCTGDLKHIYKEGYRYFSDPELKIEIVKQLECCWESFD